MKPTVFVLAVVFVVGTGSSLSAVEKNRKGLNTWLLSSYLNDSKQVQDLGVGTVRIDLRWDQVEPSMNRFEWMITDKVIETARANNVEVLFTLRSISSWGTILPAQEHDLNHNASAPKAMADWAHKRRKTSGKFPLSCPFQITEDCGEFTAITST